MPDLPSHCPDCGQALAEPQQPAFWLGAHPVWCATCEGCHPADVKPDRHDLEAKPCTTR